ncbi:hypothetical protein B0T17DRAFT_585387 [Bombardia bombarda]|uniref:Carrier domain-containing protein n=1 Tax=Bombardia bombarda TaxID=252184 RepID=A0AA39WAD8_9PEZI|nr:hypothetical protein B0T17DRAFT_585387 [Bombardia bombarda]
MAPHDAHMARLKGDNLLPHIVDRVAREQPGAEFGLWPIHPTSYEPGFYTVTYGKLASVVNGLAWWLVEQLGPGSGEEVLTYVGPNDVRISALLLAAIKTGYVVFFTSPRNSPDAQRSLFSTLKCKILITIDPTPTAALAIMEAVKPPRQLVIPSVDELLSKSFPHYIYAKTFEKARLDPFMIIHTSGSTGLPRPLVWTQEAGVRHQISSSRDPPDGSLSVDRVYLGKRIMVTLPHFHGAGLFQYGLGAIPFGNVNIGPLAGAIMTGQALVDALHHTPADVAMVVPSVVAEIAQDPELLDYCARHLKMIIYMGGDLPQALGDRVAAKMKLRCQWGASEVGIPPQLLDHKLGPQDWRYIRFHPCVGVVFEKVGDGIYELVFRRSESLADTQALFAIRGQEHLEEYRTRDLFEQHPTVPDAWCWRARADDIVVFLNGEKTNPIPMEQHVLASNPELSGVLVVGNQRFQAGLLIEPVVTSDNHTGLTTAEQAALIERVWPSVEEANRTTAAHARVEKSLILVTTPDRPLIRTGKATIQRYGSLIQYTADIEKLYANADMALDDEVAPLDTTDPKAIGAFIRDSIKSITGWPNLDLDSDSTFFERGMDSLQALQLTRALRRGLHHPDIALSTVYRNPTVSQLTAAIIALNQGTDNNDTDADLMEPLLATYRELIRQIPKPERMSTAQSKPATQDVILTGSTGSLGTHILHALLNRPGIGHIFCLNRGGDGGRAAQRARFIEASLPADVLDDGDRVSFIHTDLSRPLLGLDKETYETLRTRVRVVVHNGWTVNFNLGLVAFRPALAGLVNLFTLASAAGMRMVFVSSISAVTGPGRPAGEAPPEEVLEFACDTPMVSGYARSKFLSELLCDAAVGWLGVDVAVARMGQIAGTVLRAGGVWNMDEWLPSLVVSSVLRLGGLPGNLGGQFTEVDWMPVDLLGEVMVDLAVGDGGIGRDDGAKVFNIRNSRTTTWKELLPVVADVARRRLGRESEVVSSEVWLARLKESDEGGGADAGNVHENPAVKLLNFYCDSLWGREKTPGLMAIEQALVASPSLRDMPPVGSDWMSKWVGEWIEKASP